MYNAIVYIIYVLKKLLCILVEFFFKSRACFLICRVHFYSCILIIYNHIL
jgi:hypothetical protein